MTAISREMGNGGCLDGVESNQGRYCIECDSCAESREAARGDDSVQVSAVKVAYYMI